MIKNRYPGKFIVFEGIDGAGGETQSKLLSSYLGKGAKNLSYPDYKNPIGKIIHQYLHNQYDLPVETQFLLHSADFIKDAVKILKWLDEKKTVIADRYFTSTIAYQGLRGFELKKALRFAEIFNIPKPDLIIYLDISPETSMRRKLEEKGNLDRNEKDKKFSKELKAQYRKMAKKSIFGEWVVINGEKSIEEVFEEIKKIIDLKR